MDRKVLSEVYAVVMAMGEEWAKRIPADVWEDICAKKEDSYTPYVDENKELIEQGLKEDTITFIAMLYLEYWCHSVEEKEKLLTIFQKNEAIWKEGVASAGSVRGLLHIVHKG